MQEGKYTGRASTRAYAWMGTDPARTGFPDWVFQPQARFVDYVAWALDVPLYFLERGREKILGWDSRPLFTPISLSHRPVSKRWDILDQEQRQYALH